MSRTPDNSARPRGASGMAAGLGLALLVLGGSVVAGTPERDPLAERMAVVDKTEVTLVGKVEDRSAQLRERVRALYKLTRSRPAPDAASTPADERGEAIRRRAASKRILLRDLAELKILEEELASVRAARERIATAQRVAPPATPDARSLTRPVPGRVASNYGRYRGRRSKTRLTQRGIRLAARAGESVVAPHAGVVAYAGPVRGIEHAVVIARDDGLRSVVGHLGELHVASGARVEPGAALGTAGGTRVYLEVRVGVGAGGLPVDPAPLLKR